MTDTDKQMDMFGEQRQHDGVFYNTTNLVDDELAKARKNVKTQNEIILYLFKIHGRLNPAKVEILTVEHDWPITSIRRAITTLTDQKLLFKTSAKVEGAYGKLEHVWEVLK